MKLQKIFSSFYLSKHLAWAFGHFQYLLSVLIFYKLVQDLEVICGFTDVNTTTVKPLTPVKESGNYIYISFIIIYIISLLQIFPTFSKYIKYLVFSHSIIYIYSYFTCYYIPKKSLEYWILNLCHSINKTPLSTKFQCHQVLNNSGATLHFPYLHRNLKDKKEIDLVTIAKHHSEDAMNGIWTTPS